MDGAVTTMASGSTVNIVSNNASPVRIWGGTLNNGGTINWSGGPIEVDTSAVINNLTGGVIDATDDQAMYWTYNGQPTLNNAGLFEKTGGTGTTTLSNIIFNNTGIVEVDSGTLEFGGGVTQISGTVLTGGTWIIKCGGALAIPGATILSNQGNVTLDGLGSTFPAIAGLQQNSGNFTITNGQAFQSTGAMENDGKLHVGPGSLLTINGPLSGTGSLSICGGTAGVLANFSQTEVTLNREPMQSRS